MGFVLSEEVKHKILVLAREALCAAAEGKMLPAMDFDSLPSTLKETGASFVTLTKQGALRGCIGTLEARIPLAEDVREHTIAAARHDFRFPPVRPEEVKDIHIEVSILNPPQKIEYHDADELLQQLRPGIDGVIITDGIRRATFLPQVWEKIPSPSLFLCMLSEKAGLPPEAWKSGKLDVYVYQVETLEEEPSQLN